jgi:hypothetical protein
MHQLQGQELQARITINASRVSSQVDKKIFQTLQNALNNFLNNRKWTKETYGQQEKINCNFLLNIAEGTDNIYKAALIVQAGRPIFNSTYESPLINFQDENVAFRYVEYQPIDFNENRVSGSDGLAANLTAILAYYVYTIIGLDSDSYALRGGDPYFVKAQNIVNNSPDNIEEYSTEPSENLEGQLAQIRDEDDVDVNMSTKERGSGSQFFYNGEGYTRAKSGKGAPMFWQNVPSNQTWV